MAPAEQPIEAPTPDDEPAADASEPRVYDTGPIVVEADEEIPPTEIFEDSPIETQRVTREEIETTATSNVAEVVARVPGFRTQQRVQGEEAAVSVEGLPPEYTKILVNGQRYTGVIGEVADLADVPVTNVERIELKRGSQGIRYGSDAAGAVIDVLTRPAPDAGIRVNSEAGGGTDSQVRAGLTVAPRIGPVGVTVSYTRDQIDGFDSRGSGENFVRPRIGGSDSERRSDDFYATVESPVGESLELFARGGWRMEEEDIVTEEGVDFGTRDFDRALATGGVDWQITDTLSLHNEFTYYGGWSKDVAIRPIELYDVEYKVDSGAEMYWDFGPFSSVLFGGMDLRHDAIDLETGETSFESAPCSDVAGGPECVDVQAASRVKESFTSTGLIAQNETTLWEDRVSVVLGVRYQIHSEFEDKWLPQAAVLLKPLPGLRLRFYWSQNYRTPSLRDLYQPETIGAGGNYLIGGNPGLDPEESISWRAGFEYSPAEWITLASTGFWNEIDDFIITTPDESLVQVGTNVVPFRNENTPGSCALDPNLDICQVDGEDRLAGVPGQVFRPANLDFVRTRGFETQLRVRPHRLVALFVGWTYLDSKVESKIFRDLKELPNEPEHTVDIHTTVKAPVTDTTLAVTARFRGKSIVDTSGTGIPAFSSLRKGNTSWIVDLRLTQPFLEKYAVFFDIRNTTDQDVVDSYEVRGRTYFAGLRVGFGPQ